MSHQVIIAKVPKSQLPTVTADIAQEHGTVVSSHDNGDDTVTLTVSFPDSLVKSESGAMQLLAKLLHEKIPVSFTSF